jgi:predicted CoA-binding protein
MAAYGMAHLQYHGTRRREVPRIVAVIGASNDRATFGNRAVRAFRRHRSVLDAPGPIDMASLYVHPEVGERVIEEVARKGIPEVWLNPGAKSDAPIARARALKIEPIIAGRIVAIGENPYEL